MNYISHHEVARQYDPDSATEFLFGSFVSDFARMSGNRRVLWDFENPALKAGIEFHIATNKIFDSQPAVKQLEDDLLTSLETVLPHRTAIQSSHVSKDLLLDGLHINNTDAVEAFQETLKRVLTGGVNFEGANPDKILNVAWAIHQHGPPHYDSPLVVARSLHRVLSRTRTPLVEESLGQISKILAVYQPTVLRIGPIAIYQTVERLKEARSFESRTSDQS